LKSDVFNMPVDLNETVKLVYNSPDHFWRVPTAPMIAIKSLFYVVYNQGRAVSGDPDVERWKRNFLSPEV